MLDDYEIISYDDNINTIIDILKPIIEFYPSYREWLENTVNLSLSNNSRKIKILRNNTDIVGLSILKNTIEEKKICSLFVSPNYRGEAWFYSLYTDSINFLDTTKPIITIPEPIVKKYHGLIFTGKWKLTSKIKNRYKDGIVEYGFSEK